MWRGLVKGSSLGRVLKIGVKMYITNPTPELLQKCYKCKKRIADYLIYKWGLPVLTIKDGFYYFVKTNELDAAIREIPVFTKLLNIF
jgi:hypothetical protein